MNQFPWAEPPEGKGYRRGTHRLIPPAETLSRIQRYAPALGITRVANVTGLDTIGIPVVMVCRPNSRALAVSQGKGLRLDDAKASGLMESIESWHAERISLPLKLATYNELRYTHKVVDVRTLLWRKASLYNDDFRLLWIEGLDLLRGEQVWLPFELVHIDLSLPAPMGTGCFALSSNGLASGNHPLEAVLHALNEVVERHVCACWMDLVGDAVAATRLDLDTVDDPGCREALELYRRVGVRVAVWEMGRELGVPAFRCMVADRSPDTPQSPPACGGMGCHSDRGISLLRALTEAAQSRLTMIAGSRDDLRRSRYDLWRNADSLRQWHRQYEEQEPALDFRQSPHHETDRFEDDVQWLLGILERAGVRRAVVFDLSHDGLEIPVFRVVVPGFEALPDLKAYIPRPIGSCG